MEREYYHGTGWEVTTENWSRPSWIGDLDKLPERYKGALA